MRLCKTEQGGSGADCQHDHVGTARKGLVHPSVFRPLYILLYITLKCIPNLRLGSTNPSSRDPPRELSKPEAPNPCATWCYLQGELLLDENHKHSRNTHTHRDVYIYIYIYTFIYIYIYLHTKQEACVFCALGLGKAPLSCGSSRGLCSSNAFQLFDAGLSVGFTPGSSAGIQRRISDPLYSYKHTMSDIKAVYHVSQRTPKPLTLQP